jgi:DNA-binding NarL/FixJ family response regulator
VETVAARKISNALIIDDHPLFCDALSMTLRTVSGIVSVDTVSLLEDAIDHLAGQSEINLIVLDLNLPDVSGLDGLIRLRAAAGDVPIVVVSSITDNRIIGSVLRAGARGFVPKHSPRDVFRDALDTISRDEVFRPDGFVEVPADDSASDSRGEALERLSTLTNQQARILQLICEGKLNKQIAYDLSIAETTVKAHVTAIMRKLGVQSRTQAVLIAGQASFSHLLPSDGDTY